MPDRIIKESICTSETLNQLTDFEERFWNRLTVNCDDYGRFDARPAILKGRLFPLMDGKTHKDMTAALLRLASVGLVELYEVDGRPFLQVVTWSKHQRIRAKRSKFPPPAETCCHMPSDDSICPRNPIQSKSNPNPSECGSVFAPPLAAVMSAYLDKINPTPSQTSLDELKGYVERLGAEVCLRAIDKALDAGKATWNYIRGTLRSVESQGVRCIADWDKLDAERKENGSGAPANPNAARATGADGGRWNLQSDL